MTDPVSLLPPMATARERAVSLTSAERYPWPDEVIRAVWDPARCPSHLLGHLAWAMSVDIWVDDWGDAVKRGVIARSLDLHRRKGTLSAIRDHVEIAGGRVIAARVPPQGFYVSADPAETSPLWRRWLHALPEIRICRVATAVATGGFLVSGGDGLDRPVECFLGAEDGTPTACPGGPPRWEEVEYAVVVKDGIERRIGLVREPDPRHGRTGEVLHLALPVSAGPTFVGGEPLEGAVLARAGAADVASAEIVVALGPPGAGEADWNLVVQGLPRVQDVQPTAGLVTFRDPGRFFGGDGLEGRAVAGPDEVWGTWLGLRLLGPGAPEAPSASFLDADRLGMAPYTAEITVDLRRRASPWIFVAGDGWTGVSVLPPLVDDGRLAAVCDAVTAATAARDRVLVDLDIPFAGGSLTETRRLDDLKLW